MTCLVSYKRCALQYGRLGPAPAEHPGTTAPRSTGGALHQTRCLTACVVLHGWVHNLLTLLCTLLSYNGTHLWDSFLRSTGLRPDAPTSISLQRREPSRLATDATTGPNLPTLALHSVRRTARAIFSRVTYSPTCHLAHSG